ncbi:MAG: hypothetical protein FJ150_04390 [Euryarchaeota archaeon]|nr:hypothetical protein [Euryarchaeota archaeon]
MACNKYKLPNGNTFRFYSYVVTSDTGFAPHPSGHYCTLACCKPIIRKTADVGDWVIGTGSKKNVGQNRLIYAMRVSERLTFDMYFRDKRFHIRNDSIYYKKDGKYLQKMNPFHDEENMDNDLKSENVLISDYFYYFGKRAIKLPKEFRTVTHSTQGHKCNFDEKMVINFLQWLEDNYNMGSHGKPYDFDGRCTLNRN